MRLSVAGTLRMFGNTDANAGDARAQAREMFARIGRTLAAAGLPWADVVDGVACITDAARLAPLNEAYRESFKAAVTSRKTG